MNRNNGIKFFIFVFLLGCSSGAAKNEQSLESHPSSTYSFDELYGVSFVLSYYFDQNIGKKKTKAVCSVKADDVSNALNQLHLLWNEKLDEELKNLVSVKQIDERSQGCESLCLCGGYLLLLKKVEPNIDELNIVYKRLNASVNRLTHSRKTECVKSLKKHYCEQSVFQEIKSK